jgi:predicted lipoprotein with Yx(FWY)xxD motif
MCRLVGCLAALSLVVACSSDPVSSTLTTVPTTVVPTTGEPVTPGTIPPFTTVEVAVANGPHGDQLVDGEGRSLYMFTLDEDRTSTCEGACAEAWPPFLGDPVAGEGVDQSLLGNAERSGGAIQVTYAGHPLYFYSEDGAPGAANGHGFNDVWFLVAPSGDPVTD